MKNKLLIAIDGPAASGKGTVAKLLGEKLDLPVLHTGNIYRAVAYKIWINKQDPTNMGIAVNSAKKLKLSDLDNPELDHEQVGQYASIIGSYPKLRDATYQFQRDFIEKSTKGAVIEGRDIGTVICPEADFKFYIVADVEVRAQRRFAQQTDIEYEVILNDLKLRDERDMNRKTAPLKPADDAIILDNSHLGIQETLEYMVGRIVIDNDEL